MNWFTSDLHLNHENIIKYCSRPFDSVETMNRALIERWNAVVCSNDTVYVVGDMFLGSPEDAEPHIRSLNGRKILIRGNHDRSPRTMLKCGFDEVHRQLRVTLNDGRIALLIHKPTPRCLLEPHDIQIHGHRHRPPAVSDDQINVCVDLWGFAPISEEEICQVPVRRIKEDVAAISSIGDEIVINARIRRGDLDGFADQLISLSRE